MSDCRASPRFRSDTSPRTIASYNWLFGDGDTGTGVIVSKKYTAPGVYKVQLTTTDDAGTVSTPTTQDLTVGPTVGPTPTASLVATGSPSASKGTPAFFNASGSLPGSGANIVDYAFNFGDGEPVFHTTNPIQSHQYLAAGTFTTTVTVTDSLGRTATAQANVTVAP